MTDDAIVSADKAVNAESRADISVPAVLSGGLNRTRPATPRSYLSVEDHFDLCKMARHIPCSPSAQFRTV
jgi:hypothetical protein